MNITIIGTGYVGLVTGACLADLGNHVFCLDLDQTKIDLLNSGGVPIYEPRRVLALDLADAPALLEKLQFMDKPMKAVQGADALIIVTEWKAYRSPNWPALKTAMKATVIFDGRNLYEPGDIKSQGIEYHGIRRVVFDLNQRGFSH